MNSQKKYFFLNISIIIILFLFIFTIVYNYIYNYNYNIKNNFNKLKQYENFAHPTLNSQYSYITPSSIYEKSLEHLYGTNKKLMCNILPNLTEDSYSIDGVPILKDKFPVHLFKNPDGIILAIFNDGAIYRKNTMTTGLWNGPLDNSMPNGGKIPLRMITISPNANEYLAVGFDNKLYIKHADTNNELDITMPWIQVINNNNLIYIITDPNTRRLIGVNIEGNLMIKQSYDITSDFIQLNKLGVSILKIYFDINGYMLILDNNFNLWQMSDKDWQNADIDNKKGNNPARINDIIYDNDGKLYGIVFALNINKLQIMKQSVSYYLSVFLPILTNIRSSDNINYLMNDNSIIKSKSGVDFFQTEFINDNVLDDDIEFARVRNDLDNKQKLREFCAIKKNEYDPQKINNFNLLGDIDNNDNKINELQQVLEQLKK